MAAIAYYLISLALPGGGETVFNGYFTVDTNTNIDSSFFDMTNITENILSDGHNGGPTYLYYPGWLCFDGGGTNVTRFPYLYGDTVGDYNMYGNTSSSLGNLDENNFEYTFTSIPEPPCFNEGTKILCYPDIYKPIEELKKGDLVKSFKHGFRPIDLIGKNIMVNNPKEPFQCMYIMKKNKRK